MNTGIRGAPSLPAWPATRRKPDRRNMAWGGRRRPRHLRMEPAPERRKVADEEEARKRRGEREAHGPGDALVAPFGEDDETCCT